MTVRATTFRVILDDGHSQYIYLTAGPITDLQTLLSVLDVSNVAAIANVTDTYVVKLADEVIRCDGTFTVTLPAATGSGVAYCIKNIGTGVITVDGAGADTIDGQLTQTLDNQYDTITVLDVATGIWDLWS
jgi:hypothetical protein